MPWIVRYFGWIGFILFILFIAESTGLADHLRERKKALQDSPCYECSSLIGGKN